MRTALKTNIESNGDNLLYRRGNPQIHCGVHVCFRDSMPTYMSTWNLKSFSLKSMSKPLHGKELCRNTTGILTEMGIQTYSRFILYNVSHRLHVLKFVYKHELVLGYLSTWCRFDYDYACSIGIYQRYAVTNMLGCLCCLLLTWVYSFRYPTTGSRNNLLPQLFHFDISPWGPRKTAG